MSMIAGFRQLTVKEGARKARSFPVLCRLFSKKNPNSRRVIYIQVAGAALKSSVARFTCALLHGAPANLLSCGFEPFWNAISKIHFGVSFPIVSPFLYDVRVTLEHDKETEESEVEMRVLQSDKDGEESIQEVSSYFRTSKRH